ncbi:hypothetical protein DYB32_007121 [Aphanomyces invadans]|uniref:Uncharacterized protein n=1 Tax=Aphanomyces invadans TaxID=157072 RepID=A0A3R6Y554_9STRA|nr:hypothetical protein DYB32_007121 [Aphanomyces invadans]
MELATNPVESRASPMDAATNPVEPGASPMDAVDKPVEGAAATKRARSRRDWYDRNKAKAITHAKEYSQVHKERIAAQKKAWDARNRDKKRAQMKAYYIKNKDRIKEYRERVKQGHQANLARQARNTTSVSSNSSSSSVVSNSDSEGVAQPILSPRAPHSPNAYLAIADLMVTLPPVRGPQSMTSGPLRSGATSPMNIAALLNPET